MLEFLRKHRKTRWALITVGTLVVLFVLLATLFDWNMARAPIARMITAKTGRLAGIEGNLRVHLWSLTPTVDIESLHIGNPDWAKHSLMFGASKTIVSVSLGRLLRGQIVLPRVEVLNPEINLERDAQGRESWEFSKQTGTPPAENAKPTKLPAVRLLVIQDGKVNVEDQLKKLTLTGTLSAGEKASQGETNAFQLRLTGLLNAKPLNVDFNGGPLVDLNPSTPYNFEVSIVASTIHLTASVSILKPFDLREFTAKLHLSGQDLADAYYLTGLALPNTAPYDIAGNVHRDNALIQVDGLTGRIGSSDIKGSLGVDTSKKRLALTGKLASNNLNFKDLIPTLGVPASSIASPGAKSTRSTAARTSVRKSEMLFPDADLQLNRVRGMDADVSYRAESVTAPKLQVKQMAFHLTLVNGDLKINPLSFGFDQGTISGQVEIDARNDNPETSIDMAMDHLELSQFKSAKATDPPVSGIVRGRLKVHGFGTSMHKLASTADGGLGMAIPHGEINDVLAELTGINVLKGLGLLFSSENKKTEIRCGIINFKATQGNATATTLFVDTTNVLITGRGDIHLFNEDLDLSMQGDPKHLRLLRLRAPISVTGTLANPTIGIKPEKLAGQVGAAVALSALLSPVAAALAFIDPGLTKDKNCAQILVEEQALPPGQGVPATNSDQKKPRH